ncbi:MAG: GDSL-type esterase/lipase family protein [Planctomycetota bacterium]
MMDDTTSIETPPRRLTRRRKLLFTVMAVVLVLVGVESLARIGSYLFTGFNPYYLFYGFYSWKSEEGHSEKHKGYFKFPANRVLKFGTPEPARINNHGFRGEDFETSKRADTVRIICLGGSSTFGYTNRDAGTYPVALQNLFRERVPDTRVEVLNCGVPHLNTDHVVAMLQEEILNYSPGVITFYEGFNDASWPLDTTRMQKVMSWLDEYSAAYATTRKAVTKLGGHLHERWNRYRPRMDRTTLLHQRDLHEKMTRANLSAIIELAQSRGVRVVMVKQPVRRVRDLDKESPPSYEEAYRAVTEELDREGGIDGLDATLFIHRALMDVVEDLARKANLPLVDNIAVVDAHPKGLVTQVHLSEEGNARLAEAMFQALAPMVQAASKSDKTD